MQPLLHRISPNLKRKSLLALLLLFCAGGSLFAQTNQFNDDKLRAEKERQQALKSKIKQATVYLYACNDNAQPADSILISQYDYDENGYLGRLVDYKPSSNPKLPPDAYSFIDMYDGKGNIIQHTMMEESYVQFPGKVVKGHSRPGDYGNQSITYEYDAHNNLIRDVDHWNSFVQYGKNEKERLGTGITVYTYDKHGNLASKTSHDLDGKFTFHNQYIYSKNNELLKNLTYLDSTLEKVFIRQEYQYNYTKEGLKKLELIYNHDGVLVTEREYVYDRNGNQPKGYEIVDGVRELVWDYKYNDKGQLIESYGGPARRFGPGYLDYGSSLRNNITEAPGPARQYGPGSMDIRRDGLAKLVYAYDEDGNLTQIKKYERDTYGEEKLTLMQKWIYKKY